MPARRGIVVGEEAMGDEIKFIVAALNQPPFQMRLTLVSLHSKKGVELLQVVNDIFAWLDAKHKKVRV